MKKTIMLPKIFEMEFIKAVGISRNERSLAENLAWFLWGLVVIFIIYKCIETPAERTVVNNYLEAAWYWKAGEPVYFGDRGFLYLPQFAFLMSFIADFPRWSVEIIERLIQLPVLLAGLYSFCQFAGKKKEKSFFPLMTVAVFLMGFSSFRNGQTNIAILGFMLLSVVALAKEKWTLATVLMTLGLVIKPTFVVFYLLAAALHRALYWRLPLGLLIIFLVPMLFADAGYVVEQYAGFIHTLKDALHLGVHKAEWASFFGIFPQVAGYFVPEKVQLTIRLILALCTLGLAWYAKRHFTPEIAAYFIYALPACYLMLFNPRNENNDYAVLSAAIGFWLAAAYHRYHSFGLKWLIWVVLLGIVGSYEISVRLTPGMDAWVSPVAGTVFTIFLVIQLFRRKGEYLRAKRS